MVERVEAEVLEPGGSVTRVTRRARAGYPAEDAMTVLIGTSGWQYRDWRGALLPAAPAAAALAGALRAALRDRREQQRLLPAARARDVPAWRERTPPDFRWAVKASRYLTHIKRLREPEEPVGRLMERAAGLGDKLDADPAAAAADAAGRPRAAARLPGPASPVGTRVAVEPRHDSWWTDEIRALLERYGAALCWADRTSSRSRRCGGPPTGATCGCHHGVRELGATGRRPSSCGPTGWPPRGGGEDVLVYFNNDPGCAAVADAVVFADAVRRRRGDAHPRADGGPGDGPRLAGGTLGAPGIASAASSPTWRPSALRRAAEPDRSALSAVVAPPAAPPDAGAGGAPGVWELPVRGSFDLDQTLSVRLRSARGGTGGAAADGLLRSTASRNRRASSSPVRLPVSCGSPSTAVPNPTAVLGQVARILSVDVDATGYDALGRTDPLVGRLQRARPGLRPPLFHSAYEALCWSVLSARRPAAQMAELRTRLSRAHGRVFVLDGVEVAAFPTPDQLLAVSEFPGLPDVKLERLHAVAADVARAGRLDTDALRGLDPAVAAAELQRLPGIGPVLQRTGHRQGARSHRPDAGGGGGRSRDRRRAGGPAAGRRRSGRAGPARGPRGAPGSASRCAPPVGRAGALARARVAGAPPRAGRRAGRRPAAGSAARRGCRPAA